MKYFIFLTMAAAITWAACKNDGNSAKQLAGGPNSDLVNNPLTATGEIDTNRLARIVFETPVFDFGTVKVGEIVNCEFKFTNTGTVPLSILNARSSCGCTVPEWPNDAIQPGGTGVIKAKFNTEGRPGPQRKMILITANTYPNESRIMLVGVVDAG